MSQINIPTEIHIPYPKTSEPHLKITAGVCSLTLLPGFGKTWITGKYVDPDELAPLEVMHSGKTTHLWLGDVYRERIQPKNRSKLFLSFSTARAFALTLFIGDVDHQFDFGCLPLTALEISGGRSAQVIDFSGANPQPMRKMEVTPDGGSLQVNHLTNANAAEIRIEGDATSCQLDFSGELLRSTYVHIGSYISNVTMTIPASTATKISMTSTDGLRQMPDFVYRDHAYWNCPTWDDQKPLLRIRSAARRGSFNVQST